MTNEPQHDRCNGSAPAQRGRTLDLRIRRDGKPAAAITLTELRDLGIADDVLAVLETELDAEVARR